MWESHLRASIKRLLLARIGEGFKRGAAEGGVRLGCGWRLESDGELLPNTKRHKKGQSLFMTLNHR